MYQGSEIRTSYLINHSFLQVNFLFGILLGVLITLFLRFHLYLILTNKTTIDNLEKREIDIRPFDKGPS